jgi:hypothetical protein
MPVRAARHPGGLLRESAEGEGFWGGLGADGAFWGRIAQKNRKKSKRIFDDYVDSKDGYSH